MKVECSISEIPHPDNGRPAVQATCSRCEHKTVSFGTGEGSRKRCLVLLREECPEEERNFYVDEDADDDDD